MGNPRWLLGNADDAKVMVQKRVFHLGYTFYSPNLAIFGKTEGNFKEKLLIHILVLCIELVFIV